MALLQIAEPGESTAPHQHRLAVGIDLGTTHSLVATVKSGVAEVLHDSAGETLLPSAVRYLANGDVIVGEDAHAAQVIDPENTIVSAKRFMGRGISDLARYGVLPYRFVEAPGMVQIDTVAGAKSPVDVASHILRALRRRAESALGGELVGAVVTVPAYFDDAQRQATKDAAQLAGLNVLRLLNEPTAAAIAYGLDNASEGTFAVFDLGGGTFDISILQLTKGVFTVLATNGDAALGGDDFDQAIAAHWRHQHNLAAAGHGDMRRLLMKAREVKERLSTEMAVDTSIELSWGQVCTLQLGQSEFHQMTEALVNRTLQPVRKALRDAKLGVTDIDGVVMVGGATRMPHVQRAVADLFGRELLNNLDPDKVVALGAAIQANTLAGNRSADDLLLLDVIPLSLGLETMGGLAEKVIPRNSTIPVARAQEFTTFKDGQTAMAIHVVQGERELVKDCRSLARFELRGIPPMAAGAARIKVLFQVDADGLLSVTASETTSGVAAHIEVKPAYGLSDAQVADMLTDSLRYAREDVEARTLNEARTDAARLQVAIEAALAADGAELLSDTERDAIGAKLRALQLALTQNDAAVIKQATENLSQASDEFAQRRMNHSVAEALRGRQIKDVA